MIPARITELLDRLTSSGPIHTKLSASELHEIVNFIREELGEQEPLSGSDIYRLANDGEEIPIGRALATFATPENWVQAYGATNSDNKPLPACVWAWCGPVIPPYELAKNAFIS